MEAIDLVRSWKQPDLRTDGSLGHPAGEIALWTSGALTRRADLLSERDAWGPPETIIETQTCPVTSPEADA
ncbi:hypothetical protein P3T36_006728 [Kitasatospora sp. MAP12-15]|uniref:hypothetical protein n=1 Tax=unclassified Kitasatospora TaxID=2633591 RepID=UPI002475ED92|nr:hypothetical protein [Kitasatospora sp. MAP12-44]MDH6115318.1 hypothetical protein [Kitasatospora sp. MAP12-44]